MAEIKGYRIGSIFREKLLRHLERQIGELRGDIQSPEYVHPADPLEELIKMIDGGEFDGNDDDMPKIFGGNG